MRALRLEVFSRLEGRKMGELVHVQSSALSETDRVLSRLVAIREELRTSDDIGAVARLVNASDAITYLTRKADYEQGIQNEAAKVQIETTCRLGELLEQAEKNKGSQGKIQQHLAGADIVSAPAIASAPTLSELFDKPAKAAQAKAARAKALSAIPKAKRDAAIKKLEDEGKDVTKAAVMRTAHVSHNAGENEWYTPKEYIASAVAVMGGIDTDPATSEAANEVVGAATFHTAEQDGLKQCWRGRVWMNPPYAAELIGQFAAKLAQHYSDGDVTEAIVLVNNATETAWFARLADVASAMVFPRGRVRFWEPSGRPSAPLQGQAVIYLGSNRAEFLEQFGRYGWGAML